MYLFAQMLTRQSVHRKGISPKRSKLSDGLERSITPPFLSRSGKTLSERSESCCSSNKSTSSELQRGIRSCQKLIISRVFSFRGEKLYHQDQSQTPVDPITTRALYPFVVMAHPVALRFRFHFEGDRGTNRLDKVSLGRA